MIESKHEYSLQVVVDSVEVQADRLGYVQQSDLRLSISLGRYPILHVAPTTIGEPVTTPEPAKETGTLLDVPFRGSGKSCTFIMNKALVETARVVFLLVKKVDALNDHVILAMTSPITFQELALSLPSSSGDIEPSFVTRRFQFLDWMGTCDLRIRLVHVTRKVVRAIKSHPQHPPRLTTKVTEQLPPDLVANAQIIQPDLREPQKENACTPKYGKMKNRNPVISLLKLK
jgi:hypothetical protein